MEKKDYMQKAFEMICRIQSGCSPVVWSISDHESTAMVVVTIEEAAPRCIERLMNDEIKDLPLCFISVNKGKLQVRLG